jgi:hypothetical protein
MRIRVQLLGLLLVLLGAWGGIVAYAGPSFGYRMSSGPAWQWTTAHWQLHALPGAAVVLGGLLVLAAAPRLAARLGAVLAVAAGMWLVVGPMFASMWLGSGSETQLASGSLEQVARPLGYHYGTGVLIVAVAAFAWAASAACARTEPYPRSRVDVAGTEEDQLSSILGRRDYADD